MQRISPLPRRTARVLIVEDETRLRELLGDVIPEMGFAADSARSAEEARRIMEANPREIVVLDLALPLMGGMEFCHQIRQRWPATQVIILTGFGDLESARQAIRLSVVDFLSKPCHLRDLEQALEQARRRVLTGPTTPPPPPIAQIPAGPTLAERERQHILVTLAKNGGNRTATAKELGISRRTLHYRLRDYKQTPNY